VDISNYIETSDDVRSGMIYKEKSFYLDSAGHPWKVVDVWFPDMP